MKRTRPARSVALAAVLGAVSLAATPAVTASDAAAAERTPSVRRGLKAAGDWCARCHAIRRGAKRRGKYGAPPLQAIADRPDMTAAKLRRILERPHNRMPTEAMYDDEIADLIAYIRSLRHR
jgi:mono/diheme cytochrome c family protein